LSLVSTTTRRYFALPFGGTSELAATVALERGDQLLRLLQRDLALITHTA
jgi:hypothetical protein